MAVYTKGIAKAQGFRKALVTMLVVLVLALVLVMVMIVKAEVMVEMMALVVTTTIQQALTIWLRHCSKFFVFIILFNAFYSSMK